MKFVKVSICIPAYNQVEKIRRSLDAISIQTYRDFEVIIADDSDNNEIAEIIEGYKQKFLIIYKKNVVRKGTPNNWNYAVSLASGEYIKLMHHDDWFADDESLSDFVSMLDNNSGIEFAFSPSINVGPDGKVVSIHEPSSSDILEMCQHPEILLWGNRIGSPSATIYKRQDLEKYDQKLKWVVDNEYYYRLLIINPNVEIADRPLICIDNSLFNRVTEECITNRSVQIYENLYFYIKIKKGKLPFIRFASFFWKLFRKWQVNDNSDFKECGVDYPIPTNILLIAYLQHFALESVKILQKKPCSI